MGDRELSQNMPTVPLSTPPRGLPFARRARRAARLRLDGADSPRFAAIEAALVRRSVGALSAGRHFCRHCHRTPLVGERVYLYAAGDHDDEIVCELCLPRRRTRPERSVVVRSPEQAGAVRAVRRPGGP